MSLPSFDAELNRRLESLREAGLYRELRKIASPQSTRITCDGRTFLNFSSNDYLGLANDTALKDAAIRAISDFGTGSGASRLICGSLSPHHELEETLAAFKGAEAALAFSSGYAAAQGTLGALLGKDDAVVLDKLSHACLVDAARLCGAKLRVFAHNDLSDLEDILKWADQRPRVAGVTARTLIVTESVFSMDGDHAPLRELVALKEKYGAWLLVDEAHATGLYGANRRGLAEEMGIADQIEIQMGTLGKALGAAGGYIAGSRSLVDFLINRARTFIFSTAPLPAAAAAATAGVKIVQINEGEVRRKCLWERTATVNKMPFFTNSRTRTAASLPSAIVPIHIGNEADAVAAAAALRALGVWIPAIRYPTVARGQARLRLTVTAGHSPADLAQLESALASLQPGPSSGALSI
jgi:8-amino-7-oxononanoate synthase